MSAVAARTWIRRSATVLGDGPDVVTGKFGTQKQHEQRLAPRRHEGHGRDGRSEDKITVETWRLDLGGPLPANLKES